MNRYQIKKTAVVFFPRRESEGEQPNNAHNNQQRFISASEEGNGKY